MLSFEEIKDYLDHKVLEFNRPEFIELDPISIPHMFSNKEDIEISAFLTATISWGNRKAILNSSNKMILKHVSIMRILLLYLNQPIPNNIS